MPTYDAARTLQGKVALVTGAGRGLGRALAERLASLGADVAIHGMREHGPVEYGEGTTLTAVAEAVAAAHGVRTIRALGDLTDGADIARVVEAMTKELGPIDILVHNAGGDIAAKGGKPDPNDAVGIREGRRARGARPQPALNHPDLPGGGEGNDAAAPGRHRHHRLGRYLRVPDGIYFEVGGTSTNIGVIRNGRPTVKYVRVGGHETYVSSLDVRVIGIAGGSMVRARSGKLVDVGPRSAHIAGLPYAAFARPEDIVDPTIEFFQPKADDPDDYVAVRSANGTRYAITNTCAANVLGYAKPGLHAHGNLESARRAIPTMSRSRSKSIKTPTGSAPPRWAPRRCARACAAMRLARPKRGK